MKVNAHTDIKELKKYVILTTEEVIGECQKFEQTFLKDPLSIECNSSEVQRILDLFARKIDVFQKILKSELPQNNDTPQVVKIIRKELSFLKNRETALITQFALEDFIDDRYIKSNSMNYYLIDFDNDSMTAYSQDRLIDTLKKDYCTNSKIKIVLGKEKRAKFDVKLL